MPGGHACPRGHECLGDACPGGCACLGACVAGDVCAWGACAAGGHAWPGGAMGYTNPPPPWTEFLTNACENYLPQLLLRAVKMAIDDF